MKPKENNIQPLAYRLLPDSIDGFFGQKHLFGKSGALRQMLKKGRIVSSLFWGPPGSGKSAFARFLAKKLNYKIVFVNAVESDVSSVRKIIKLAEFESPVVRTLLVVDEIEDFNKQHQNIFLPCLEKGSISLIAICFENPFHRLNPALLSRLKVFEFKSLSENDLRGILENALVSDKGLNGKLFLDEEAKKLLVGFAAGDARKLLTSLELAALSGRSLTGDKVKKILREGRKYDRDDHYNMISAFIKSVRGSDTDAALYWLAAMLKGGEDPRFIARRLLILASEDIGNADPQAIVLVSAAASAVEFVGMPEARIILSQAVIYCSKTYKSNACYEAISAAEASASAGFPSVPRHLTKAGAGDYKYPHSFGGWVSQKYADISERFYRSRGKGFEKELERREKIVRQKAIAPADAGEEKKS
ncbi:MAG: replication-associated recombination protein A [Elusimicrobia bacterium]|nr:replication-associated recombination protein A [Elusimicrobiota bacterium]